MNITLDSEENERNLKRMAEVAGNLVPPELLVDATERALAPALGALHAGVRGIGVKTGRLRKAPAIRVRKYARAAAGGKQNVTVMGLVGFRSSVAPHDWYVEFGTNPRRGRGVMPASYVTQRAYEASRSEVTAIMSAEMRRLAEAAVKKLAG